MLRLIDARTRSAIDDNVLCGCLKLIQSFIIRRAICSVPTNALNKLFTQWTKNFNDQDTYESLLTAMKDGKGGSRFPSDAEFENAFVKFPQYSRPSTTFILKKIEASFGHKEQIDLDATSLTVEHVMPQTLTADWEVEIGENFADIHDRLLHTMGNLTLTAYNPELGNMIFSDKKKFLKTSHVEMNRYIAKQKKWNEQTIISRANKLFDIANKIWEFPK